MPLFIANAPFHEICYLGPLPVQCVQARLSLGISEPQAARPPQIPPLEFILDTGAEMASVSTADLRAFEIPRLGPVGGWHPVILADGSTRKARLRDVALWLYSNLPGLAGQPHRIDLNGVLVYPRSRRAGADPPLRLLGMNALLDAGLKIEINGLTRAFSVWVPPHGSAGSEASGPATGPDTPKS